MTLRSIVVIGASVACVRAVQTFRQQEYDGRLTLLDADPELPMADRPVYAAAHR